jgi:hypothetical protein
MPVTDTSRVMSLAMTSLTSLKNSTMGEVFGFEMDKPTARAKTITPRRLLVAAALMMLLGT